jgi:hypothetical protein
MTGALTASIQLRKLLRDPARPGAPEPTLLPWLARRAGPAALGEAASAAAASSRLAARDGRWPAVADAVASVIADRSLDPATLTSLVGILPPVAGYLDAGQRKLVQWTETRPDSLLYAALARRGVIAPPGRSTAGSLPPLADLRSLAWLASHGEADVPPDSTAETVYLLPFQFGGASVRGQARQRRQAVEAITVAADDERYWYAGALLARTAPYLGAQGRVLLRPVIAGLPAPWSGHLTRLIDDWGPRWESDEAELAASHPAIAQLTELAAAVDPDELAAVCQAGIGGIRRHHGLDGGWKSSGAAWVDRAEAYQGTRTEAASIRPSRDDQHLLGIAEPEPARFVNIYLAEAGQDQPVNAAPLSPERAYDVCCNIGPADSRSLVERESAAFPEKRLPDAPLPLLAVLFAGGRKVADTTIDLPATGATEWVRLRLPAASAPSVIHAELAIYYGIAVVVLYELTIPVGGSGGYGPQARLRYRLSRSLTDLEKLAGRRMSVIVPSAVPAVYVNGLDKAPQEFSHSATEVRDAAYAARQELYFAHFITSGKGKEAREISRYTATPERCYEKSLADLTADMSSLARAGATVFEQLFPDESLRPRLRAEAEAYGRPPVLQVVSLGGGLLSIPWAAIYDLPLSDDPSEYEPCRAIAAFGPRGHGGDPPARCPYEAEHRDLNQLCPWGFWGLSAIIEYPPSVESRDLEVRTRPAAGLPEILMGYDTNLDSGLRLSHIAALRARHGTALLDPQLISRADVEKALRQDRMDVLYLYCHVFDDPGRPDQHIPAIGFGSGQVTGKDISAWGRVRLSAEHPLVVLNGCHSAEVGPESLYNLVTPFVRWAKACGLVGTEVTIEQGLGGWAMELFLSELGRYPVGMALRAARWQMFGHGNLMGLAYTPYCLASLTLAP